MKKLLLLVVFAVYAQWPSAQQNTGTTEAKAQVPVLEQVLQERAQELARIEQREARFLQNKARQQQILADAKAEFERFQRDNNPLKQRTENNAKTISELEARIAVRKSEVGDLDSVFRQMGGDFAVALTQSPTSMQLPGRAGKLAALSDQNAQASLDNMEQLWLTVLEELTYSGQIAEFTAPVVMQTSEIQQRNVFRIGTFSTYLDGGLLQFIPETNELLQVSIPGSIIESNQVYFSNSTGTHLVHIDPSAGALLNAISISPGWQDRLEQGGIIGKIILGLGALGALLVLWRTGSLGWQLFKLNRQLQTPNDLKNDNAMGRVLLTMQASVVSTEKQEMDPLDTLQVQLDEAVLNEVNGLEKGHNLIKLLAATAPLLGLLGTVTGMIITFQSISLFGSGDPKLMAGGISQALVTTVLGLIVAIPLLFGHSLVSAFADSIIRRLDEQSAGYLARLVKSSDNTGTA